MTRHSIGPKCVCSFNAVSLNRLGSSKSQTTNIQLHHPDQKSEFQTTAGQAHKTSTWGVYSISPLSTSKGGMCRHKKDGGEGCIEEKGSSSPCSQIPSTPCIVCNFFVWCGLRWEVRGGIPSPGTVQQRALPCDPVASADASSGSRPRSREGVNPQK